MQPTDPFAGMDLNQEVDLFAGMDLDQEVDLSAVPVDGQEAPTEGRSVTEDIGTGLKNLPNHMLRGASEAAQQTLKAGGSLTEWAVRKLPGGDAMARFVNDTMGGSLSTSSLLGEVTPDAADDTVTGQVTAGVAQFLTGFMAGGKVIQKAAPAVGALPRSMAAGAASDAIAFDPWESRVSDLIQDFPSLENPINEYLAADPTDSELEGRFKNALEGLALGGLIEGVFRSVKAVRDLRNATPEEAAQIKQEAEEAIEQVVKQRVRWNNETKTWDPVEAKPEAKPGEVSEQSLDAPKAGKAGKAKNQRELPPALDEQEMAKLRNWVNGRAAVRFDGKAEWEGGTDFNFTLREPENKDALNVIQAMSHILQETGDPGWLARRSQEDTLKLAEKLGADPASLMKSLKMVYGNSENLDVVVTATRMYHNSISARVSELADQVILKPDDVAVAAQLEAALEQSVGVHRMLKGVQTEIARALASHKIVAGDAAGAKMTDAAKKLYGLDLSQMTRDQKVALAKKLKMAEGDPLVIYDAPPKSGKVRDFIEKHNEVFINSILSGPRTHAVNMLSSSIKAYTLPIEDMLGGAVTLDRNLMRQGADELVGVTMEMFDAVRILAKSLGNREALDEGAIGKAIEAFQKQRGVLDPMNNKVDIPLHAIGGAVGNAVRIPGRMLMAEDEVMKQIMYRANTRATALREGRSMGLSGKPLADFVQENLDAAVDANGAALRGGALQRAREVSWTQDLGEGSLGNTVQQFVNTHPGARVILPFVRTPTNLMRDAFQHLPGLGAFQFQMRQDLAAGGIRRQRALGKQALGTVFWGSAAFLAMGDPSNGDLPAITGRGPSDPDVRKLWMAKGWQPYSFRVEDGVDPETGNPRFKYVSYQRMDPFGVPFGVVADLVEIAGETEGNTSWEDAVAAGIASVMRNVSSKSYLQGLVGTLDAVASGDPNKVQRIIRNQVGAYVPNLLNQLNPDTTQREVRTLVDELRRRTPGFSDNLPARRNLFGEKMYKPYGVGLGMINPLATTRDQDDEVYHALAGLGRSMSMPPEQVGRLSLTDPQWANQKGVLPYDRWMELMGEEMGGMNLKKELAMLVKSEAWKALPDPNQLFDGPKLEMARKVKNRWVQTNFLRMLQEYPELRQEYYIDQSRPAIFNAGGQEAVDRLFPIK